MQQLTTVFNIKPLLELAPINFDGSGPAAEGTANTPGHDVPGTSYARTDHEEGTWLKRRRKKKKSKGSKGSKKRRKTA